MRVLRWALLAMLWPAGITYAQTTNIQPLTIGDTLPPDIVLENVINSPASKIHLNQLKNDLVVLDFFATWCKSCLSYLPKLDSLRGQPGIKTLIVSYEPEKKITDFLKKRKDWIKPQSPIICSDTLLESLFPHRSLPHYVVIYKNKVRAITYPYHITLAALNSIKTDENFKLPFKWDNLDFDREKRLLVNDNGGSADLLLLQSSLIKSLPGLSGKAGIVEENENNLTREYFINYPLIDLLAVVFPEAATNRVLLKVKDSIKFYQLQDLGIWSPDHVYSYEIIYQKDVPSSKRKNKILSDLKIFFGLNCYYDTVMKDCWVLRQMGAGIKQSKKKTTEVSLLGKHVFPREMINAPLSTLTEALNYQIPGRQLNPIVLDETGFNGTTDLKLPIKDLTDFATLTKLLAAYNISLTNEKRPVRLLVIEETSSL